MRIAICTVGEALSVMVMNSFTKNLFNSILLTLKGKCPFLSFSVFAISSLPLVGIYRMAFMKHYGGKKALESMR